MDSTQNVTKGKKEAANKSFSCLFPSEFNLLVKLLPLDLDHMGKSSVRKKEAGEKEIWKGRMRGKRERGQKAEGKEERKEGDTCGEIHCCKTMRAGRGEEQRDRKAHIHSRTRQRPHPTALQWSSA